MASTFEAWLRQLAAARQGPVAMQIDRGVAFRTRLVVGAPLSGAVLAGSLRLAPDAGGAVLASFTCGAAEIDGDYTGFAVTLTSVQTAALPADTDGDALVELAFDFLLTPSGGTQKRLFGGVATVAGKVTNGT